MGFSLTNKKEKIIFTMKLSEANRKGKKHAEFLYAAPFVDFVDITETLTKNPQIACGSYQEEDIMNKTELIAAVAEKAEISKKDAEKALKAFTDTVAQELKNGEKVQLVGFGTFEVSHREAREGRNPRTGETMKIAATKMPKFKAGKALKDMMN